MAQIPFYRINAFTGNGKLGNPAGICLPDRPLTPAQMQAIAKNMDLPATVFYYPAQNHQIRWFTPTIEIPLCGHGTLAASFLLLSILKTGRDRIEFTTAFGDTLRAASVNGLIEMDFPVIALHEEPVDPQLSAALNTSVVQFFTGTRPIAVLGSAEEVINLRPDFRALFKLADGIGVTALGDGQETDIVSRCFYKTVPAFEDPVTGSLHCALGPLWYQLSGKTILRAVQASERGGFLITELQGDRILIKGKAELVAEGHLYIP